MPVVKQNFPIRRPDPNIGPKSSPYLPMTPLWLHQEGEKRLLVLIWILNFELNALFYMYEDEFINFQIWLKISKVGFKNPASLLIIEINKKFCSWNIFPFEFRLTCFKN